jgi:hypothetical protein
LDKLDQRESSSKPSSTRIAKSTLGMIMPPGLYKFSMDPKNYDVIAATEISAPVLGTTSFIMDPDIFFRLYDYETERPEYNRRVGGALQSPQFNDSEVHTVQPDGTTTIEVDGAMQFAQHPNRKGLNKDIYVIQGRGLSARAAESRNRVDIAEGILESIPLRKAFDPQEASWAIVRRYLSETYHGMISEATIDRMKNFNRFALGSSQFAVLMSPNVFDITHPILAIKRKRVYRALGADVQKLINSKEDNHIKDKYLRYIKEKNYTPQSAWEATVGQVGATLIASLDTTPPPMAQLFVELGGLTDSTIKALYGYLKNAEPKESARVLNAILAYILLKHNPIPLDPVMIIGGGDMEVEDTQDNKMVFEEGKQIFLALAAISKKYLDQLTGEKDMDFETFVNILMDDNDHRLDVLKDINILTLPSFKGLLAGSCAGAGIAKTMLSVTMQGLVNLGLYPRTLAKPRAVVNGTVRFDDGRVLLMQM